MAEATLITTTSRRAILSGIAAAPLFAIPALCQPAENDPVFAAIKAHSVARARLGSLIDDGEWEEAEREEFALFNKLVEMEPRTLSGASAFATYVANVPDAWTLAADAGFVAALASLGRALSNIGRA